MYDLDELAADHDVLWQAIRGQLRRRGIDAPPQLTRATPAPELWRDPQLLLSQACGWPVVTELASAVRVVGAFGV